jgi:hypothetical protein
MVIIIPVLEKKGAVDSFAPKNAHSVDTASTREFTVNELAAPYHLETIAVAHFPRELNVVVEKLDDVACFLVAETGVSRRQVEAVRDITAKQVPVPFTGNYYFFVIKPAVVRPCVVYTLAGMNEQLHADQFTGIPVQRKREDMSRVKNIQRQEWFVGRKDLVHNISADFTFFEYAAQGVTVCDHPGENVIPFGFRRGNRFGADFFGLIGMGYGKILRGDGVFNGGNGGMGDMKRFPRYPGQEPGNKNQAQQEPPSFSALPQAFFPIKTPDSIHKNPAVRDDCGNKLPLYTA